MLQTELLGPHHNRKDFSCGVEDLDRYIHQQVGQDRRRNITVAYVLTAQEATDVIGYYTLNNAILLPQSLPPQLAKKLSLYNQFPAILIGRLVVDRRYQGKGFGGLIIVDALQRCLENCRRVGTMAVIVEPTNDRARSLYERFGFRAFADEHARLFIPITEIQP